MPAASQTQDRSKALATALAQIDKSFGKGSVMRLGDESRPPVSVIPTGSVALDVALGVGGLPRGRIVEVYGPEYLDTFLERRIRRNVRPFLSEIDASQTTPIVTLWREHAEDAEAALRRTIEAVRRDPTPPT